MVCLGGVCLGRPYHFKFFKSCLTQILLGPFLNTLSQLRLVLISELTDDIKRVAQFSNDDFSSPQKLERTLKGGGIYIAAYWRAYSFENNKD